MLRLANELPLPSRENFRIGTTLWWTYNETHLNTAYYMPGEENIQESALLWKKVHDIRPACEDSVKIYVLDIDLQNDFCNRQYGTLFVGGLNSSGAEDDSKRITESNYRNLSRISKILRTGDAHEPIQIFFSTFWDFGKSWNHPLTGKLYGPGDIVPPFTLVTHAEVKDGYFVPKKDLWQWVMRRGETPFRSYDELKEYCLYYTKTIERIGMEFQELEKKSEKYVLCVWPPHCRNGSWGQNIVAAIYESELFFAIARNAEVRQFWKGSDYLTEAYSAITPEVCCLADGTVIASELVEILPYLKEADILIVRGQAASHCVRFTVSDALLRLSKKYPAFGKKLFIARDCMSPVTVTDDRGNFVANYAPQMESFFDECRSAGGHIVEMAKPMEEWEGFEEVYSAALSL